MAGIGAVIVLGMLAVYWYEIRPAQARSACAEKALDFVQAKEDQRLSYSSGEADHDYDFVYEHCMHQRGVE